MAEWLYEDGIGEARAVLLDDDGEIVEAHLEWDDCRWRPGAITHARMGEIDRAQGRAFVTLPDDSAAILSPLPAQSISQGAALRVEVMREPLSEGRRRKWPKVRLADPGAEPRPAPSLLDRISVSGVTVRRPAAHETDALEAAGWSELLEEAATGEVGFPGGALHLSLTPAMTLIDVDGTLPRAELAVAGAAAAARAIRRMGIGGSIGIDLPTVDSKAVRLAAAAGIDSILPQPFERTAVNGFGFIQIIRRRDRRSLPELLASDPARAAAAALLRRAERCGGSGAITITAAPEVIARIEAREDWRDLLMRRTGRSLVLRAEPGSPRWGGHVDAQNQ